MSESVEMNWNQVREAQLQKAMDEMALDTTQKRVDEKIAMKCKAEIIKNPTRHRKFKWEEFLSQK